MKTATCFICGNVFKTDTPGIDEISCPRCGISERKLKDISDNITETFMLLWMARHKDASETELDLLSKGRHLSCELDRCIKKPGGR